MLKKLNLDYLFLPTNNEIYPDGANKKINISPFAKKLCGKSRPDHFKSVADVIDRFIKIIKPNKIYFGEKDMQQLKIIEDFISRNKIITRVIGCKTIREKNGIACSSRNLFLSLKQKTIASKVYKLLINKKQNLIKNKSGLIEIKRKIHELGVNKIEYIEILDINKLIKPYIKNNKYKIFIAYYLGTTRLIDNI
jgi:pantoate--beta-alanine ligase